MKKLSQNQFEEFMQGYLIDVIKVPSYRLGQAFLNAYPEIDFKMNITDSTLASRIWASKSAETAQKLILEHCVETE